MFNIKQFNLRKILITNYSDFIQAFFETDFSKKTKDVKKKREYNLKFFKLSKEVKKSLENKTLDQFVVMEKELIKISNKGKRPVIVIDELQALEDVYINGQRELLKELFNFFVSITKESHLCHVIIASSDGYFLNRIYNDSKLTKTSSFLEVDYLNQQDTIEWLSHLKENSSITAYTLSDSQIGTVWKYLGGSAWEISKLLSDLMSFANNNIINDRDLNQIIDQFILINTGKINYYTQLYDNKYELFKHIHELQSEKNEFQIKDKKNLVSKGFYDIPSLVDELNNLVRLNILSFNPITSFYKLQGHSMLFGLKKFIEQQQ